MLSMMLYREASGILGLTASPVKSQSLQQKDENGGKGKEKKNEKPIDVDHFFAQKSRNSDFCAYPSKNVAMAHFQVENVQNLRFKNCVLDKYLWYFPGTGTMG